MLLRVMLTLAITLSAMAAEVRLGPETPLSAEIEFIPTTHPQYPVSVASSGGHLLALWQLSGEQIFQLARIGAKPAYGIRASSAVMTAAGDELLVAFVSGSTVYVQRAGNDGQLLGEPQAVTSQVLSPSVTHLVFDGTAFLLMVLDRDGITRVLILDRQGMVLRDMPPFWQVWWAGVQNGQFAVIAGSDLTSYVLYRFSAFGPRTDIPVNLPKVGISFIASSPSRIFVGQRQFGTLLEPDGSVARQMNVTPCTPTEHRPQSGWWDGSRFVSTCLDGTGRLDATRYRDDGSLDGAATLLSSTADRVPLFATNETDQLLVWADHHFSNHSDVVARVVHGSDSVAPGAELERVAYTGRAQYSVQIARAGAHRLAVWTNEGTGVEPVLDGRTVFVQPSIGRAAVVAGTRSFLTVWTDSPDDTSAQLLARRVGFAGELLDPLPRVLANDIAVYLSPIPGVGFRAPLFVAATAGGDAHARARGITEDGELVDVAAPGAGSNYVIVKPMWNGDELQFANASLLGGLTLFFDRFFMFGVARPGAASVDVVRSGYFYGGATQGAIAQGPDRLTFAWVETSPPCAMCVAFAQSTFDGRLLRDRTVVTKEASVIEVEAVWDGAEFVIAWSGGDRIRAVRFDINGQPLDASPFEISPPGATSDRPSFAVTSTGVDVAYTRYDGHAGGASRAFVRTLDRLPPLIPRRASVRH